MRAPSRTLWSPKVPVTVARRRPLVALRTRVWKTVVAAQVVQRRRGVTSADSMASVSIFCR